MTYVDTKSTMPCGCDEGAGWICHMHQERAGKIAALALQNVALPTKEDIRTAIARDLLPNVVQQFDTGATRNADGHKLDFEGFLEPGVLQVYGEYMQSHRLQRDGTVRDSDNWQKGIPLAKYMKSLLRHTFDLWRLHRGYVVIDPDTNTPATKEHLCCAILFNVQGYLFELLKGAK